MPQATQMTQSLKDILHHSACCRPVPWITLLRCSRLALVMRLLAPLYITPMEMARRNEELKIKLKVEFLKEYCLPYAVADLSILLKLKGLIYVY